MKKQNKQNKKKKHLKGPYLQRKFMDIKLEKLTLKDVRALLNNLEYSGYTYKARIAKKEGKNWIRLKKVRSDGLRLDVGDFSLKEAKNLVRNMVPEFKEVLG